MSSENNCWHRWKPSGPPESNYWNVWPEGRSRAEHWRDPVGAWQSGRSSKHKDRGKPAKGLFGGRVTGCPGWGPLVPVLSAACSKRLSSVMGPRRPSYRERLWAQHNSVQERGPIPRMRRTSEAAMYGFRSHPSPPAGGQATRGPRLPAPTAPQSGREARRRPRWLQPPTPRRMSKSKVTLGGHLQAKRRRGGGRSIF